ncbi:MAG TPA: transposase [Ktedonobacterales bacterium]|jgi:putative transposase
MQLVEQHVIKHSDSRFAPIDAAAFAAKNLYNAALYEVRQTYIFEHRYLGNSEVYHRMKPTPAYRALPRKVGNSILRQLDTNWRAFFAALEAWKEAPGKFLGRPKLPKYKHKTRGRFLLIYDLQALSRRALARGRLRPSGLDIEVQTGHKTVKQARIVPRAGYYVVEIVYEQAEAAPSGNPALVASVDIGVDNLAALTSNKPGFVPRLVNGRPIKSTNHYYNKRRAALQEALSHLGITARMARLTTRRTRRINHYLHTASKAIIALLAQEGIGTLIVGKNAGWKQEAELGRVNNQHFVGLPHARFIQMLAYKAKLAGMRFVLQEESYTSRASALDSDAMPLYDPKRAGKPVFSGKRIKRGLYQARDGRTVNADVNGSANILRKALPNAFEADGIEAVAVRPVWLTFAWSVQPRALAAAPAIPTSQ